MNEKHEPTEFDVQLNDHPEVKELRKQLSGELKQLVETVALLAVKIREVWPTIEGAEAVPALPLVVYQIAETLKQDMCVLAMDTIQPGWELEAQEQAERVIDLLKALSSEMTESTHTLH